MKVLVVDDSSTMRRIIKNVLNQLKIMDVVEAEDGQKGLSEIEKENFDLILTDWNMPNMNGHDMVINIRKVNKKIPIIMITTEGAKEQILMALKAGVNNYVVKPFNADTLKGKIETVRG